MLDERLPQAPAKRHVERINPDTVVAIDLDPPRSDLRQIQSRTEDHQLNATKTQRSTRQACYPPDTATVWLRIPRSHHSLSESWDQTSSQVWLLGLAGC
jgi:hypothetical protein